MQTDVTPFEVRIIPVSTFAASIAELLAFRIATIIAERGSCRLALAGGETPRAIHGELVKSGTIDWTKVWITFGDERCVPADDKDSNYLMAKESLLDRVPIPASQVMRVKTELGQEEAALAYEADLAGLAAQAGEPRYAHDLVLLGIGPDGHTASLFPGQPSLDETERNVIPATGPKPPPQRITMTFPLLNAAREVWFMTAGAAKLEALKGIFAGDQQYPAARVRPVAGKVRWLIGDDLKAAAPKV